MRSIRAALIACAFDLRMAWRLVSRSIRLPLLGAMTVAVGVAAVAIMTSIYTAVVVDALPFPAPNRLVLIEYTRGTFPQAGPLSQTAAESVEGLRPQFIGVGYYDSPHPILLHGPDGNEMVLGVHVSSGFFSTLGMRPHYGEWIGPGNARDGRNTAVISWALWRDAFGSRQNAVGSTVVLNNELYEIAGVMPERFAYPGRYVHLWLSDASLTHAGAASSNRLHNRVTFARLADGVTPRAALAALEIVAARLRKADPGAYDRATFATIPLRDHVAGGLQRLVSVICGTVVCLLIACCASLTGLLSTFFRSRQRDLTICWSLGGVRVVRLCLHASGLIVGSGLAAGLGLALLGIHAVRSAGPATIPRIDRVSLDSFGALIAGLAACGAGLISGGAAARQLRRVAEKGAHLAVVPRLWLARRVGLQHVICGLQVAVATFLAVGAALLTGSFVRLEGTDMGFEPNDLLSVQFTAEGDGRRTTAVVQNFLARAAALPNVISASMTSAPLLMGTFAVKPFRVQVADGPWLVTPFVPFRVVSPEFFRTVGIPIVRGRTFSDADDGRAPCAVIVNEAASALWPGHDPLGRQVDLDDLALQSVFCRVVGVARDARLSAATDRPQPELFFPARQRPDPLSIVIVRMRTDAPATKRALLTLALSLTDVPQGAGVSEVARSLRFSLADAKLRSLFLIFFAAIAGLLACFGVYGVGAHTVRQRTHELGVRLALGSPRRRLVGAIVMPTIVMIGGGLACGLAASLAFGATLQPVLFETAANDTTILTGVVTAIGLVALTATILPARRGCGIEPSILLRER